MPQTGSAVSKPSFLRTLVLAVVGIAVFFLIDTFLERTEKAEGRVEAQRFYEAGKGLMKQGLGERAANEFRAALSTTPENQDYQLALGQALLAAGRLMDAEATLADLLQRKGTEGAPNLAMARVLVKEGRIPDALSYYHRSIYGQWKQDALGNRVRVRFELIDLLVSRKETQGLLAELLPLEEEAPDDPDTKMKLGLLFVAAGAPDRGAELFRDVLRKKPQDAAAYAGLGEAEFARENYRAALGYFLNALRMRPEDDVTRRRVETCNQVLALDPTQRGLSADEQFRRSVKVLDLIANDVRACLDPGALQASRDAFDAAAKALRQRVQPARLGSAYESNLDLIDQLWQIRKSKCTTTDPEYLSLLLNRLKQ